MRRLNRTNTIFFSKEINKFVIDKNYDDLTLYDKALLRNNPDKYTTDRPLLKKEIEMNSSDILDEEDELNDEEYEKLLEKRNKKQEKAARKSEEKFWDYYDKYKKNPKKFKKGLSKTERRILKYFNQRKKSKNGKKRLSKEEKYIKKIRKENPILYTLYLRDKRIEEDYQVRSEIITGIPFNNKKKKNRFFTNCNPNKQFTNNVRDYNDDQVELLENLEAEIMERLNSPELFTEGIEIKDFSVNKKKNKKFKEGDLTRLMLP